MIILVSLGSFTELRNDEKRTMLFIRLILREEKEMLKK